MGMKIATMGVVMTYADSTAQNDISRDVLHCFRIQSSLKFGRHESITIARIDKAYEMDRKQSQVEGQWNDYEAEETGKEVFQQSPLSLSVEIVVVSRP